jgi:hypothetical protein
MAKFVSKNVKVRSVRQLKLESHTDLNLTFLSRLVGPIHSRPIAGIPRGSGRAVDIGISKADQLGRLRHVRSPKCDIELARCSKQKLPENSPQFKAETLVRQAGHHTLRRLTLSHRTTVAIPSVSH